MTLSNTVVITGSGWEARIPVISAKGGQDLLTNLLTLVADKVCVPQAIQDGDMNICAFVVPSEIRVARLETAATPKFTQEQMLQEHYATLKAQRAYYESHTRKDDF